MKKQSNLSSLMGYAGGYRILTYLSWILSVMSALLALVPFWYIWRIIHDNGPDGPGDRKAAYSGGAFVSDPGDPAVFHYIYDPSGTLYPLYQ